MSEQLIQASRDFHFFLSMCPFPLSGNRAMCRGYHLATWAPYGSISRRETLNNIKMLLYTFIAAPSLIPSICLPYGVCTSIRLSYVSLCQPDLGVTHLCQGQGTTIAIKIQPFWYFKLEQTITTSLRFECRYFIFMSLRLINKKTHGSSLPEVSRRAISFPHKESLLYTHESLSSKLAFSFSQISPLIIGKVIPVNVFQMSLQKLGRSTCVHASLH